MGIIKNIKMENDCLLEAKRKLLLILVQLGEELTDNEVDIMYLLSKDKDIQKLLNKNKNG